MNNVEAYWNHIGSVNPHWGTNTRGGSDETDRYWDTHMHELHAQAEARATWLHHQWQQACPDPEKRVAHPRVLDLGCGAGFVTSHVASWSAHVTAVDIAASYRALATEHFQNHQIHNTSVIDVVEFELQPAHSYDLVYSLHCLQHNPPAAQTHMIRKCLMLLRDRGVAIIQTPSHVFDADTRDSPAVMSMHAISPDKVRYLCDQCGVKLLHEQIDQPTPHLTQVFYTLIRE